MNKGFDKTQISEDPEDRTYEKTANFREASKSPVRYSSLIFKTTTSDYQEYTEPVANYELKIKYPTSTFLYVDGNVITSRGTATGGYYTYISTDNINKNTSCVLALLGSNSSSDYVQSYIASSVSGCYAMNDGNGYKHTLSNFTSNTEITLERDATTSTTVTASNCTITYNDTAYTSGTAKTGKVSDGVVKVKVTPADGYSITGAVNGASSNKATFTETLDTDGTSKIYTISYAYGTTNCNLNVTLTQNVTQIPITINVGTTSAFSVVKIDNVEQTISSAISASVLSNATSFTLALTLNDNYSLTTLKVNNVTRTISGTTYTITLDGSTEYVIDITTTYTEPTKYRDVYFSNPDLVTITVVSPSGLTSDTKIINNSSYTHYQIPYTSASPATMTFNYSVQSGYSVNGVAVSGCTKTASGSNYVLSDFTADKAIITFSVESDTPVLPNYSHSVSISGVSNTSVCKYEINSTETTVSQDITGQSLTFASSDGMVKYTITPTSGYKVTFTVESGGTITADTSTANVYYAYPNSSDSIFTYSFSVVAESTEPTYNYEFTVVGAEYISTKKAVYGSGEQYSIVSGETLSIHYDEITLALIPASGCTYSVNVQNGVYSSGTVTANNSTDTVYITITGTNGQVEDNGYNITVEQCANIASGTVASTAINTTSLASADVTLNVSTDNTTFNFEFTANDSYDIETVKVYISNGVREYKYNDENYPLTREGRSVLGTVTFDSAVSDVTIELNNVETLHTLVFEGNSGSSKKWTTQTENADVILVSPTTLSSLSGTMLLCFDISATTGLRYVKLKFKHSGAYPTTSSIFYFGTSDGLNTADTIGSRNTLTKGTKFKGTDSNVYISSAASDNATYVTIDLASVTTFYKYIYLAFSSFTNTGNYVYISQYQYRDDVDGLTIGSASTDTDTDGSFGGEVIIDGNVVMECDVTGETLPYNSYDFTIVDENAEYNPITPNNKLSQFEKYQQFYVMAVVQNGLEYNETTQTAPPFYYTQIARVKFNNIESENGIARFNFIGTIEYYDNVYLTAKEKQKFCFIDEDINTKEFLNTLFGTDVDLSRVDGTSGDVFSDTDTMIVPFEDESKAEIARIIAQANGMYIFEDNDGKIRFRTLGDVGSRYPNLWQSGKSYKVNDIVYRVIDNEDVFYKCKTAHTSGTTFNSSYWDVYTDTNGDFTFKIELEQSFSNPRITSTRETFDSLDITYHYYALEAEKELDFTKLEAYYMPNDTGGIDVREPELWVKYFEQSSGDSGIYYDSSGNQTTSFEPYLGSISTNYVKFRFYFDNRCAVSSMKFANVSEDSLLYDDLRLALGNLFNKTSRISADELNELILTCYSIEVDDYNNNEELQKISPCAIVTEEYVEVVFALSGFNGNQYTEYWQPFNDSIHDLDTTSNDNLIIIYAFDILLYTTNMVAKQINDNPNVYHYLPYGTNDSVVEIDNPLITSQDEAKIFAPKAMAMLEGGLYEIENDWKGDGTLAVGDTVLNGLPVGTDFDTKTYRNFKTAVCKSQNYALSGGLSATTKTALPDELFFSLENSSQFGPNIKVSPKIGDKVT